jgi:hypothetical protein
MLSVVCGWLDFLAIANAAIKTYRLCIDIDFYFFYRRGAEFAEKRYFMFAVERTANIKGNLAQITEKSAGIIKSKWLAAPAP